mmetsp:Transcript_69196/g.149232  ORF Transcript_69196/g.149232 Transcript_69196/m.149232 type:complete len:206 (+) Transcript_69196:262-879(+)
MVAHWHTRVAIDTSAVRGRERHHSSAPTTRTVGPSSVLFASSVIGIAISAMGTSILLLSLLRIAALLRVGSTGSGIATTLVAALAASVAALVLLVHTHLPVRIAELTALSVHVLSAGIWVRSVRPTTGKEHALASAAVVILRLLSLVIVRLLVVWSSAEIGWVSVGHLSGHTGGSAVTSLLLLLVRKSIACSLASGARRSATRIG